MVWECQACSYIFDSGKGEESSGIQPGTLLDDLPEGWKCPVCGVGSEFFEEISGTDR